MKQQPCLIGLKMNESLQMLSFGRISELLDGRIADVQTAISQPMHFIVNSKNKYTLSLPGRFGFLTEPMLSVQVITGSTINRRRLIRFVGV